MELNNQRPSSHPLTAPVHPPERVTGPPELHHSEGRYRLDGSSDTLNLTLSASDLTALETSGTLQALLSHLANPTGLTYTANLSSTDLILTGFEKGNITNTILPEINITVAPAAVAEDGTANLVYTFSRTGPPTDALTVNYTVSGTATEGTDYASIGTTAVFAAGSSTATVIVDPTADGTAEADETVILSLAAGAAYTIGSNAQATGTITNDDQVSNERAYSGDYDWTVTGTPDSGRIVGKLNDYDGDKQMMTQIQSTHQSSTMN